MLFLLIVGNFLLEGKLLKPISHLLKDITRPFYSIHKKEDITYDLITNSKIEALEKEIQELKDVLALNSTLTESEYVNATTLYRTVEDWNQTITVDKGSSSGIVEGMPVVTKDGLIGVVKDVSKFTSTIELLSGFNNIKISVKIQQEDQYVYGLLNGYDKEEKVFHMEGISNNLDLKEGSIVTTTGMGNLFPAGIFIGTTQNVEKDHFDLTKIVNVKSNVTFEDIPVVTILKRKDLMK